MAVVNRMTACERVCLSNARGLRVSRSSETRRGNRKGADAKTKEGRKEAYEKVILSSKMVAFVSSRARPQRRADWRVVEDGVHDTSLTFIDVARTCGVGQRRVAIQMTSVEGFKAGRAASEDRNDGRRRRRRSEESRQWRSC